MANEPKEPVDLQLLGLYGAITPKYTKIASHINEHIVNCKAFRDDLTHGGETRECAAGDKICFYFRWFYPHHFNHCHSLKCQDSKEDKGCDSCQKLREWLYLHSADCRTDSCPIEPCQPIKLELLKGRLVQPHKKLFQRVDHTQNPSVQSNPHSHHVTSGYDPYHTPTHAINTYQNVRSSGSASPYSSENDMHTNSGESSNESCDTNGWSHDQSHVSRNNRTDSVASSTISVGSGPLFRSDISDDPLRQRAQSIYPPTKPSQGLFSSKWSISTSTSIREDEGTYYQQQSHILALKSQLGVSSNDPSSPPVSGDIHDQQPTAVNDNNQDQDCERQATQRSQTNGTDGFTQTSVGTTSQRQPKKLRKGSSYRWNESDIRQRSDTIEDYLKNESSETNLFTGVDPESTLPVTSLPCPLVPRKPRPPHRPVQRKETQNDFKKIVFSNPGGRNSISLPKMPISHDPNESCDVPQNGVDQSLDHKELEECRKMTKSPRQSRELSLKRKQQLKSQEPVISDSPELKRKIFDQSNHGNSSTLSQSHLLTQRSKVEGQSANNEDSNHSDSESLNKHRERPWAKLRSDRDVYSPSSDSSPGPSSMEEVQQRQRRPGTVALQRVDTGIDEGHSKILMSGSITPADFEHIRNFNQSQNLQELVKLRAKRTSSGDPENSGNRTSGISSSTSMSNSSVNSARSSRASTGAFSELEEDFSSLEKENEQDAFEDTNSYNYETEDSSSTLIGNLDSASTGTFSSGSMLPTSPYTGTDYNLSHDSHPHTVTELHTSPESHLRTPSEAMVPPPYGDSLPHPAESVYSFLPPPPDVDDVPYISPWAIARSSTPSEDESDNEDEYSTPSVDPHAIAQYVSPPSFQDSLQAVDETLHNHKEDFNKLRHKPTRGKVPTHDQPGMTEKNKQRLQPVTYPVDRDIDYFPRLPKLVKRSNGSTIYQHEIYREMIGQRFPDKKTEEPLIRRDLEHRERVKELLLGHYYSDQVYREYSDWSRVTKLGIGAQATCFSVRDIRTECILVMKEQNETKKTMDEAYISLKFACQSNPSPNIIDYYSAALLPGNCIVPPRSPAYVQIFMECMPACLQGWLFKYGPIPLHNVTHYASQLFDALDFLHNKHRIIHCDIKPANILVDDTAQRIKLTDFGAAELLEENNRDHSKCFYGDKNAGTLAYNPSEFYRDRQCSFAFDIWQAGCCVLAMCTGRRPWRHLFMDVHTGKQPDQLTRAMKQYQRNLIGHQRQGHMYPAFLDYVLKKLLHGCLHADPSQRLTAKECTYLLNTGMASSEEERTKVLKAIGYTSSRPEVLKSFKTDQSRVDVYLGSDKQTTIEMSDPKFPLQRGGVIHHAMHGGWLGSIECPQGMTYQQAEVEIHNRFPVAQHLAPFLLASYDNSPYGIWSACSGQEDTMYRSVRPNAPVDRNAAIILSPCTETMV